ncbi:AAA family ATPase [Tsukamurella paurometabola]|uniref:Cytochrome c biogenesis protein CcmA n=1 Tax=Tsukamurella paurometabola TaxID=2061 RepID=A0A3P8MCC8_TSUPA|nr:AAA family ATPase [Tsukamurella paurometabola]UEA85696.1 ATP-binding protein [Tsukamurella paurometabola]VDR40400.1 cytochrome c biogenesis protein CcmA [Tsukamurella paurometabola]
MFRVVGSARQIDRHARGVVFLWLTDWDDWFKYQTLHLAHFIDEDGRGHALGEVKIGNVGLQSGRAGTSADGSRSPTLPQSFTQLPEGYFSLGQDDSYYATIGSLGDAFRESILRSLRDIAFDATARDLALHEEVTRTSLLRTVTIKTVEEQYSRMARGGARLTPYSFSFTPRSADPRPKVSFSVTPGSRPPSNIHVIIGRNGVGKSTFLTSLATTMVTRSREEDAPKGPWNQLSNIVSVSFSAFDEFVPMRESQSRGKGLSYHYVGLKKKRPQEGESATKDMPAIRAEMTRSLKQCLVGARRARLRNALGILENDPIFAEAGLADLLTLPGDGVDSYYLEPENESEVEEAVSEFGARFGKLSSGHKIVLLSIAKLVETVEEKSLVLLDEPEAHLHPPLLSAFVRALSDLLTDRNGMAVVATHSPVVLQEVPRDCVWKLSRSGNSLRVDRPRIETFGENVGILTDEVFGLEVTSTGFHRMLADAAMSASSYDEAVAAFEGHLGSEARSILRAMMTPTSPQSAGANHVGG